MTSRNAFSTDLGDEDVFCRFLSLLKKFSDMRALGFGYESNFGKYNTLIKSISTISNVGNQDFISDPTLLTMPRAGLF